MSPIPDSTTVLIVGAGPAGLAAALSLIHHGLSVNNFVIVDAVAKGENTSRALVVHAATLEALDTIGCGDAVVAQGAKETRFFLGSRSHNILSPCIESLERYTRHPYALIIPQILTEHALADKLDSCGVIVHRPLKVVELKRNAENPQLTDVTFDSGKVVTAKYVIGADGVHSVVRESAGIGFSDPIGQRSEDTRMVLADVTFEGISPENIPFGGTMSCNTFFLVVPMPTTFNDYLANIGRRSTTETLYRIGCSFPEDGKLPQSPPKEYLQNLVDRFGPYKLSSNASMNPSGKSVTIKDVYWSTWIHNRTAIADKFFTRLGSEPSSPTEPEGGVIFLIGDAAHVHFPAGGQGMNLGLRDAVFLGEAITKHIQVQSETKSLAEADKMLREFAEARHARALQVIGFTRNLLSLMGVKYRENMYWCLPISSATMRDWTLWMLGKIPFMQRMLAWELSGLGRR